MVRIAKPGGIVIAAEPNNLFNIMAFSSITADEPVDRIVQRSEYSGSGYRVLKEIGRCGDSTIGDLLPGHVWQAGITDIAVTLSDRAAPLIPPYESQEQKVHDQAVDGMEEDERTGREDEKRCNKICGRRRASEELFENQTLIFRNDE